MKLLRKIEDSFLFYSIKDKIYLQLNIGKFGIMILLNVKIFILIQTEP